MYFDSKYKSGNGVLMHAHEQDEDIEAQENERELNREDSTPNLEGNWA